MEVCGAHAAMVSAKALRPESERERELPGKNKKRLRLSLATKKLQSRLESHARETQPNRIEMRLSSGNSFEVRTRRRLTQTPYNGDGDGDGDGECVISERVTLPVLWCRRNPAHD